MLQMFGFKHFQVASRDVVEFWSCLRALNGF